MCGLWVEWSALLSAGSIVNTDRWKGYRTADLALLGLAHNTVNHSTHFKDPDTGTHTNTIEGTWAGIRLQVPRRNRTQQAVDGHLMTFVWRRRYADDIWGRLLHALRTVLYAVHGQGPAGAIVPDVPEVLEPAEYDVEF